MSLAAFQFRNDVRVRAARRLGVSLEEYVRHINHGHVWCRKHKEWVHRSETVVGVAENTGVCRECRRRG